MDEAKRILEERGTPEQIRVCQWLWDGSFESEEQLKEYTGPWDLCTRSGSTRRIRVQLGPSIRNFEQAQSRLQRILADV